MQRRRFAPALLAIAALALSACSTGPGGASGPLPEASGGFGDKPELTFPDGEPADTLQVEVLAQGEGPVVEAGDLLLANYLGQIWAGEVFDNSYDRGAPSSFPIGAGGVIEGWDEGLVGQTVGSRVLLSIPPELGYGEDGNPAVNIAGTDTLAFVVDIVGTFGSESAGADDATPTDAAAAVQVEIDGAPGSPVSVTVPEGLEEPSELSTTPLASASGDPAAAGQLIVQYAATFWDNSGGESTWEMGRPTAVDVGVGGPFDGLVGLPVGSRALVKLPGTDEQPAIAVVVDILAQSSVS